MGVTCTQETAGGFIIRDEDELDEVEFGLREYAKSLQDALGREIEFKITKSQKENKDWLNEYKKNVRPIEIGKFYIHPSWEESKDGFENIIIDPALAFGSGHHESTSACIEYLQKYVDMPIIMVTTEGGKAEVITALKAGVNNYIVKPFTPQVLKEKLEDVLG